MSFEVVTPVITLVSAILRIITILLQQRGASLGAGFGSPGELFTARRGLDKNLFDATVILAVVFVLSILAGMIVPGLMA